MILIGFQDMSQKWRMAEPEVAAEFPCCMVRQLMYHSVGILGFPVMTISWNRACSYTDRPPVQGLVFEGYAPGPSELVATFIPRRKGVLTRSL